ncbi:MAG: SGNH/GDSL hydrolase family protein [Draconibacterium sp.]|nr:SGNH/GDSL hydrolase family protein [Draconibacterium sp.]
MTNKAFYPRLLILVFFFGISFYGFSQVSSAWKMDANMVLKKADADGIVWFDAHEKPFGLVGFEWINNDGVYRRLPVNPDWEITKHVDDLSNHTAGGQVRFSTNSKKILVKVELAGRSNMYHMPATGQSGFDLYVRKNGIQRYIRTTRFPHDSVNYQYELYKSEENKLQDFTINFPLYNGVKSLQIGIGQGSIVQAPPAFSFGGKIVIYGTSITQGGCVSRPGMAYSNILSRKLDAQFVNLGFSGNGKGEPALANLINQIFDVSFIILDYEANAGKTIKNTLVPFIEILREQHPQTPILVMSKIRYAIHFKKSPTFDMYIDLRDFQKNVVVERVTAGDKNIYFLDGSKVLGDDYYECTVDGVHPSDLGSDRIANALLTAIKSIVFSDN